VARRPRVLKAHRNDGGSGSLVERRRTIGWQARLACSPLVDHLKVDLMARPVELEALAWESGRFAGGVDDTSRIAQAANERSKKVG
jgi:hypothetical protein